jgi:hypothetical protein
MTQFWKDLLERAARTFVQAFLATLGIGAAVQSGGVDYIHLPYAQSLVFALGTTLLSLLTSFVAGNVGTPGNASFIKPTAPTATELNAPSTGTVEHGSVNPPVPVAKARPKRAPVRKERKDEPPPYPYGPRQG